MSSRTRIIAEAAQGYEGKPDYCRLLVKAAVKAGADAIKFQIVYADDVAEPGYQYYDWYKTLEMPVGVWQEIRDAAREAGIAFFCDVSGERALDLAAAIAPDGIKFHASNFFNRPLIHRGFESAERVFISLGGIFESEIVAMVSELEEQDVADRVALLYGFQAEPTPVEKSALNRFALLKARFPRMQVGYLDHSDGAGPDRVTVSAMAVALGADWIEKHITLSRHLEIEDFASALEPDEFADYVAAMRRLETALGASNMDLSDEERAYRDKAVKKILTARDLDAGREVSRGDLDLRRSDRIARFAGFHDPGDVIGRRVTTALPAGAPLLAEHFE